MLCAEPTALEYPSSALYPLFSLLRSSVCLPTVRVDHAVVLCACSILPIAVENSYQNELYVSTWASVLIDHTCSIDVAINLSSDRALITLLANNHRVLRNVVSEESLFAFESALLQKVRVGAGCGREPVDDSLLVEEEA